MSWSLRFRPPRSLLAVLAMLSGIPGLLCLALAVSAFGDRHGADLLFAGIAAPSLLLSLAFGFAWKRTPPSTPLRNRGARIPAGGWMLAAAVLAIADPDMKSVQPPEVDLTGFDSTRYRRFWIENAIESIGKEEKIRDAVTEAVLYCETLSGKTLRQGASVYPGPAFLPDAWMGAGLLADFDGDGFSDIMVWGGYADTRILFLDGEGIRDSIIVSPNQSSEGCC